MAYLNTRPQNNWNLHGTYHTIAPYAGEYLEEIPDDIPLIDALSYAGVKGIVTSAYRPNAVAKASGRPSRHRMLDKNGYPMTLDIQPMGGRSGNFDTLKEMLLDPRLQRWFERNGYGVIDETIPANMRKNGATGPHYHIGQDSGAIKGYNDWVKAAYPVDPSVIYSHPVQRMPIIFPNTLPDNYVPGTDPRWDMYLGARRAATALGEDIQEPSSVILSPPPQMYLPNMATLASLMPKPESDTEKFMQYTKALTGQDYLNRALAMGGHLYDGASEDTQYLRNYKLMPVEEVPNMSEIPLVDFESGENLGVATPGQKVWTLNGAPVMTSDERGRADLALLNGRDPSFFGRELDNIDVTPAGTRLNRYRTLLENMENARTALDNELQQHYNNQFAANDLIRQRNDLVKADREAHERTKGLSELAATMALGLPALGTAAIAVPTMYAATAGTTAGNLIGGLAGFEALNKTGEALTGTTWADALYNSTGIKPEVGEWLNPLMFANVERAFTKPGINAMENLTDQAINYMFRNNPSTASRMINQLGNMYVPNWDYTRTNIANAINTGASAAQRAIALGKRAARGKYYNARKKWQRFSTTRADAEEYVDRLRKNFRDLEERARIKDRELQLEETNAAMDLANAQDPDFPYFSDVMRAPLVNTFEYLNTSRLAPKEQMTVQNYINKSKPTYVGMVSELRGLAHSLNDVLQYDPNKGGFSIPTYLGEWPNTVSVSTKFGTASSPVEIPKGSGNGFVPWAPPQLPPVSVGGDWMFEQLPNDGLVLGISLPDITRPVGNGIVAPPYFSIENPVRQAAQQYVDDLSARIGDNGLVVGSFKRVAQGETHSPQDVEFLTTETKSKVLDQIFGVTKKERIPAGYKVNSPEFSYLPEGSADYQIIQEGPTGKATGKVAWQRYQYLHPEEAQRLQEQIIEKRKKNIGTGDYFEEELPITPEELLTELRTTQVGDRSVEIDLMGNRKAKATKHKIQQLLSGDPQRVKEMQDVKLKSNIPNALTLEEQFPNISFDNVEANKAFLKAAGYSEEYATDPKVMRNIVANYLYTKQIFSRGTNFTRARQGSDPFISKPVKEQINLESRGNTSYGGGDASGQGKNSVEPRPEETEPTTGAIFSDTAFLYQSPITYNPEKIQTPEDIIKQLEYIKTNSANLDQVIEQIGRGAGVEDAVEAAARAQDIPFLMTSGYEGQYRGILTRDIPYGYRYVAGQNQGGFETFSIPPRQSEEVNIAAFFPINEDELMLEAEKHGFNLNLFRERQQALKAAEDVRTQWREYQNEVLGNKLSNRINNLESEWDRNLFKRDDLLSMTKDLGLAFGLMGGVTGLYSLGKYLSDEDRKESLQRANEVHNFETMGAFSTMKSLDAAAQEYCKVNNINIDDFRNDLLKYLQNEDDSYKYLLYLEKQHMPIDSHLAKRIKRAYNRKRK